MANPYKDNDKRRRIVPGGDPAARVIPEREEVVVPPVSRKPGKSLTRNISITLQEEAIEKLDKLAEEQDISRSKVINRWLMSL